jgi:uncharacterized protein
MNKTDFQSLKSKLDNLEYPLLYMFKFVVPSNNQKIARVSSMFGEEAQITLKESQKGNYTSLTIRIVMLSSDEIVDKYVEASHIEGLIAL